MCDTSIYLTFNVDRNNVFGSSLTQQPVQKKKPPPRPPPPKFTQNYTQVQKEKLKKPVCRHLLNSYCTINERSILFIW